MNRGGIHVVSPDISSPSPGFAVGFLEAFDDEYDGVIIDPNKLPSSANAFASALRAALSKWKLKVWRHKSMHAHTYVYSNTHTPCQVIIILWSCLIKKTLKWSEFNRNAGEKRNMAQNTVGTSWSCSHSD